MPAFTLTDLSTEPPPDAFSLDAAQLGMASDHPWSVTRTTLRGGRRDGVELIHLDNGVLSLAIVPTRGMGIWKAAYRGTPLGWYSPIVDGPVHPRHVHLADHGGLGWLEGFDELMVRCGLSHNGAPFEVAIPAPDGSIARHVLHGLHGRIANIPAHRVTVHIDDQPPHAITVEGKVAESTLFLTQIEMTSRITTIPGSNRLTVVDSFVNLSDQPGEMQLLYHWNLGPPYLGEGSTFHAPIETLIPRDAHRRGWARHLANLPETPTRLRRASLSCPPSRRRPRRANAGDAEMPRRTQGSCAPVSAVATALLHPLEEHRGPARRLRHRSRTPRPTSPTPNRSRRLEAGS